jgi:phosphatidylserine/phosphatidylglycerophosphate/cardiolipin synthase-like enzyme
MLLADGERAIVGSINFSPGSFDSRRELAIEVDDHHVVKALHRIAHHDWEHSHKLDLSDEGLLGPAKAAGRTRRRRSRLRSARASSRSKARRRVRRNRRPRPCLEGQVEGQGQLKGREEGQEKV